MVQVSVVPLRAAPFVVSRLRFSQRSVGTLKRPPVSVSSFFAVYCGRLLIDCALKPDRPLSGLRACVSVVRRLLVDPRATAVENETEKMCGVAQAFRPKVGIQRK